MSENSFEPIADDKIKYFSQLNFSIFTKKLQDLQDIEGELNTQQLQRKRWLKIIRNSLLSQYIQTIITFLYAAKTHTIASQHILTRALKHWEDRSQKRQILKSVWLNFTNLTLKQSREKMLAEYREKVHRHRSLLTSRYIASLPQYNSPCYNFLISKEQNESTSQLSNDNANSIENEDNLTKDQNSSSYQKYDSTESLNQEPEKVQSDEQPTVEREISIDIDNNTNIKEQKSTNRFTDFAKSIMQTGKRFINHYDRQTFGLAFIIMILTIIITYAFRSFLFWANGTFDLYKAYEFNQTLPPYDSNYDINTFVNYSQLLEAEEVDVIDILKHMAKELQEVKMKQAELIEQIRKMNDNK